ncbi:DHA2 family efflux MFS transporter permease subunit [Secundilactobacillus folii]|uniref:DHA2 family efflux MFS transporter permease subunit n=1 Tax=Secundilactobacillus folii TaxID=2678357 RepID=A0A7X2XV67_9LACO|nr:DHA2 family efflux MFS transporter permease subunit [Secundilactobacillus folii]MTV82130.1 DHA2 family efflux MFS transporter permease subunit [Secundilactobacillus folii]
METQRIPRKTILAIIGSGLLAFCGILTETSMNVTFPTLMKQFDLSMGTVQWLSTGYLLVVSLTMITSAFMQRRLKLSQLFVLAGLMFTIGDLICGLAPNFQVLLIGRLIQAVGTGYAIPLLFAIILQQIPAARLGVFMGIGGMITGIAPSLGPTYGGFNTYMFTWREIFWFILPIVILATILGGLTIPQRFKTERPQFNFLGLLFLGIAFFLITEGFTAAGTAGWLSIKFWGSLLGGLVFLMLFVFDSRHTQRDLINLMVFKSPTFVLSVTVYFLIQLMNIGISFLLPNYAQLVFGANSLTAGATILLGSLASAFVQPLSGRMLDRNGASVPIKIGSVLLVISLGLFSAFGQSLTSGLIVLFYLFFGIGFGFSFGNTMTNGIQQVDIKLQQDANATFSTSQQFAGSIGTAIMAAILTSSQQSGRHLSQRVLSAIGSQHDFYLLLLLTVIILILVWINFAKQRRQETAE